MSTIVFNSVPARVEAAKDNDRKVHVDGAHIVISEIVSALLRYGAAERYYFICESPHFLQQARKRLAAYPSAERGEVILADHLKSFLNHERLVLQISNTFIWGLSHIRQVLGRQTWPVLGMTHTQSAQDHPAFSLIAMATLFQNLRPYDCMICSSRAGQAVFQKLWESVQAALLERFGISVPYTARHAVIPLGVDAHSFQPVEKSEARRELMLPQSATGFLYFGRFSPQQKLDLFPVVMAFAQLVKERGSQEAPFLLLAGDDCEMNIAPLLRTFATDLGISDSVFILPNPGTHEKRLSYSACDVFVSPVDNVQETFGITVIEAMASGLPVIVSDWNGYRDTVAHGVNGFRVPTYWVSGIDSISNLAMVRGDNLTHWMLEQCVTVDMKEMVRYMTTLMDNPELRRKMGQEGCRAVAEKYDWRVVIAQYERLWEELMDEASFFAKDGHQQFRHGICSYDYVGVFGHYATKLIGQEAKIRLTALGVQFLEERQKLLPLEMEVAFLRPSSTRHIAALAAAKGPLESRDLANMAAEELSEPVEIARHHVARMMKYGLLELA